MQDISTSSLTTTLGQYPALCFKVLCDLLRNALASCLYVGICELLPDYLVHNCTYGVTMCVFLIACGVASCLSVFV